MWCARLERRLLTLALIALGAPPLVGAIDNVPGVCSAGPCGPGSSSGPPARREPVERPRQPSADEIRAERERRESQRQIELGQAAYQAGMAAEQRGDLAAAEDQYREALRHWGPWEVCFRMAYVLDERGKHQEAVAWYEQAILRTYWVAGNRDHLPVVHTNLGLMQLRLGNAEEAKRQFRRALDLNPRYQKARDNLVALQRTEDAETARRMSSVLQSPVSAAPPPPPATGLNIMDLSGTAVSEAETNQASTQTGLRKPREETRVSAGKVFDDPAKSDRVPAVTVPTTPAPAVQALTKHIPPEATKDPAIQESIGWYSELEKSKIATQAKLAKVQQDIKTKKGDPVVLKVYESQLTNDMQQIGKNQAAAQQAIKGRLVNLGLSWNETPAGDAPAPPKEKP